MLYLVGSTHGLEQELLTTSDDKQEEEVDEVGTKLMDEFMLFLSLKGKHSFGKKIQCTTRLITKIVVAFDHQILSFVETGLLDMCLSSMKWGQRIQWMIIICRSIIVINKT